MELKDELRKGTTTVGIVCRDGVVLAADKRVTAGYLISSHKFEKIKQISDHMAITMAGLVSDAQLFTKIVKAQIALIRIRRGKEPSIKESANLLASLTYSGIRRPSMVMSIVAFLLGGADKEGHHLYQIGVDGSETKVEDFCSDGSGSTIAYGVLETLYKKDITTDEGVVLALKAINAAMQRDVATGEGVDIVVINQEGVKKVLEKQLVTSLLQR